MIRLVEVFCATQRHQKTKNKKTESQTKVRMVYPYILRIILILVHTVDLYDTDNAGGYKHAKQLHTRYSNKKILLECSVRWDAVLLVLSTTDVELVCTL